MQGGRHMYIVSMSMCVLHESGGDSCPSTCHTECAHYTVHVPCTCTYMQIDQNRPQRVSRPHPSPEDVLLSVQVLPDDVSDLPMWLHLLVNEHLLVRAQVTNQSLGYILTLDLVSQLPHKSLTLLLHLINLTLRA